MKFSDETESLVISVPLCYNKKPDMSAPESRRFEMEKKRSEKGNSGRKRNRSQSVKGKGAEESGHEMEKIQN